MKASELMVGDVMDYRALQGGRPGRGIVTKTDPEGHAMIGGYFMGRLVVEHYLNDPRTTVHRDGVLIHPPTDAGGEGVVGTPYDLRHLKAKLMLIAGWEADVRRNQMGHADVATTSNVYTNLSAAEAVEVVRRRIQKG